MAFPIVAEAAGQEENQAKRRFLRPISLRSFFRGARPAAKGNRRATMGSFDPLEQDLRLQILGFLGPDDLAEVAMVSKAFRDDCRHESLPQERTAVIRIQPRDPRRYRFRHRFRHRCVRVESRLITMASATTPDGRCKFEKFSRLRILDLHKPDNWFSQAREYGSYLSGTATVPEVTALEWQGEMQDAALAVEDYPFLGSMFFSMEDWLYKDLPRILPNLREVDFSGALEYETLTTLLYRCKLLEKVTWHNRIEHSFSVEGWLFQECQNLRELFLDGARFKSGYYSDGSELLHSCSRGLRRVSVKGARCEGRYSLSLMSQEMLIDFVRSAPSLQWFRSDLTPENVAMLQRERPGVTFAS